MNLLQGLSVLCDLVFTIIKPLQGSIKNESCRNCINLSKNRAVLINERLNIVDV